MHEQKSAQSGFSMIELLVAVMILAVGLLGLAELQITATKANAQSDTILAASSLAQQVIEEIAALDSDDALFDADSSGVWPGSPVTVEGAGTYGITYTVDWEYMNVTNLCQIRVVVESDKAVMNVTGNKKRRVEATTLKRAT